MLRWSFRLFRIRGIQLSVHGSFLLLLAYVAYEGWDQEGWPGLGWTVALLLVFFTCVVLHELGHSFTARAFGVGVPRILLMPIGGMAEFDRMPRRPREEFLIAIAGPAVNFVIASLLFLAVGLPRRWSFWVLDDYPATALGFTQLLLHWNIWMGCFNLIPVFPMDGGRIFRAGLASLMPYLRATFWAATLGKVLATAGALIAILYYHTYLTAVLFMFIFFAGEAEYRAIRRREIEDAHWREILTRFPAQAGEPPLLAEAVTPPGEPGAAPPVLGTHKLD
jgi:Zn-dependent protease